MSILSLAKYFQSKLIFERTETAALDLGLLLPTNIWLGCTFLPGGRPPLSCLFCCSINDEEKRFNNIGTSSVAKHLRCWYVAVIVMGKPKVNNTITFLMVYSKCSVLKKDWFGEPNTTKKSNSTLDVAVCNQLNIIS